jgi:hypothetical protein
MLSASDVNAAFSGMSFSAGVESDTAGMPVTYGCDYSGSDALSSVSLTVGCNGGGTVNGQSFYDSFASVFGGTNTPVSGLGQYAIWHTASGDGGLISPRILIVFFGGNSNFEVISILPNTSSADAEMASVALAKLVLPKL